MITVRDICDVLEAYAPLRFQESYDNAGLLLGTMDMPLTGVLTCLDVTEPVIDEALANGCNMIVSHHPLVFKGLKQVVGAGRVETCLIKAIKHDIALYACHTNVDAVHYGVNGKIAQLFDMQNCTILSASGNADDYGVYGMGLVGDLNEHIDETALLQRIKTLFSCHTLRHSALLGKPVRRMAVCGGSGSDLLKHACDAGATVLLTGEASFHDFFTQGMDIVLIDAGHFETEQFTKVLFFDLISKKFPTFAVRISAHEANPVHYL